ncbi:unnamed protein product [Discosporangium mesarthrocarpum]
MEQAVRECILLLDRPANASIAPGSKRNAESRLASLPRTHDAFHTCQLRKLLHQELEKAMGRAVDEEVRYGELEDSNGGCVSPSSMDGAVDRLVSSSAFAAVANKVRAEILQVVNCAGSAGERREEGMDYRLGLGRLEGHQGQRKVARKDDWASFGVFDLASFCGGFGRQSMIDVEGVLEQMESNPGDREIILQALNKLVDVDPQDIQFGGHWTLFVSLIGHSLGSDDAEVHTKALTIHWVMYEKSEGMPAAELCQNLLSYIKRNLGAVAYVAPLPPGPPEGLQADPEPVSIIGDSALISTARVGKALPGMIGHIQETFPNVTDQSLSSIVEGYLSLLRSSPLEDSGGSHGSSSDPLSPRGTVPPAAPAIKAGAGLALEQGSGTWDAGGGAGAMVEAPVVLPAHFLALLDPTSKWLLAWLRMMPPARVLSSSEDLGLVETMLRRCERWGQVRARISATPWSHAAAAAAPEPPRPPSQEGPEEEGGRGEGSLPTSLSSATTAMREGGHPPSPPGCRVSVHRLATVSGPAALTNAQQLPLARLEQALMSQSVSFLGRLAANCRGSMWPTPPPPPPPPLLQLGALPPC